MIHSNAANRTSLRNGGVTTNYKKPALAHDRTKQAVFGENTTRSLLYVAMTRGRDTGALHPRDVAASARAAGGRSRHRKQRPRCSGARRHSVGFTGLETP